MRLVKTTDTVITTKVYVHDTLPLKITETTTNGKVAYSYTAHPKQSHNTEAVLRNSPEQFWVPQLPLELTCLEDVDKMHLFFYDYAGEIWFDQDMNPLAHPFEFDYCGSFLKERFPNDPEFAALMNWIQTDSRYINTTIGEIAYYNSNFCGQKALLRATVLPDQESYSQIYAVVKDDPYYSVRLRDAYRFGGSMVRNSPFDEATTARLKEFADSAYKIRYGD